MSFHMHYQKPSFFSIIQISSIATRLQEADLSCKREAGRSAYSLQRRSLQTLSPAFAFKEVKPEKPAKSPKKESQQKKAPSPIPEEQKQSFDSSRNEAVPTRRIRRPVAIRRPKLIGKSVEGAAMQAVAASRKRASSNQFKNVAGAAQARRPSIQNQRDMLRSSANKAPTAKASAMVSAAPRPPHGARSQRDHEERDEILSRVQNDYAMLCSLKYGQMQRLSSLNRSSGIKLAEIWWPKKQSDTIPRPVCQFLVSKTMFAWSDACPLPYLPKSVTDMFVPWFARWIATFVPSLEILSTTPTKGSSALQMDEIFLSSTIKNVRGSKPLAVVKITKVHSKRGTGGIARCQGWVINLPRRPLAEHLSKLGANTTSLMLEEKDSAAMDKLSSDLHVSMIALRSIRCCSATHFLLLSPGVAGVGKPAVRF